MARPSHPKKEVEEALRHAEGQGWRVEVGGSHAWGRIYCPYNDEECRCGEFCITSVWSTPKNPGNHARALRRVVDNCTTHRKQREAEILFEAMHTGHSVYATLHADNASETITRLTTPPISMPKETLSALAGIVVQFRHRRLNVRRTLEFAEVQKGGDINTLYRWDVKSDRINEAGKMVSLSSTLSLYAGLTQKEIDQDVADKAKIFSWMVKKGYKGVNTVGSIVAHYYMNPDEVLSLAAKGAEWHGQV